MPEVRIAAPTRTRPTLTLLVLVSLGLGGCSECGAPRGAPPPTDRPAAPAPSPAPSAEAPAAAAATPPAQGEPAPPSQEGAGAAPGIAIVPGAERDVEGLACLGRRDYACVLRLFGEGRAETPRQLDMVIHAERGSGARDQGCGTMRVLLERFPDSPEARRYRTLHRASCPH
jgi:hypothetical protein